MSDEEYWSRISSASDKKAFELLFFKFYKPLCLYAERFQNRSAIDIESIVSDLFVGLWNNRKAIVIKTSVKSYLYVSVRNRCINALKQVSNQFVPIEEVKNYAAMHKVLSDFEDDEAFNEFRREMEKLPLLQQKIFYCANFEGLEVDQIARQLNISRKTVQNNLYLAIKQLRQSLAPHVINIALIIYL